jgi:hypothetical protein
MVTKVDWENINWDLLRLEYELFGKSFPMIRVETGIPVDHLELVAQEQGWEQHPLAQELATIATSTELVNASEDYVAAIQEKLEQINTLKQQLLSPHYVKLEATLLMKAVGIVTNLNEKTDPQASKKLKDVATVLQVLLSQNGLLAPQVAGGDGDKKLIVNIMNQASGSDGDCKSAISIQSA